VCDLEYHYLTSFLWLQAIGDGLIDSQVLEMWYMSMYLSDPVCLKRFSLVNEKSCKREPQVQASMDEI
jgi:hypothetical protein